MKRKPLTAVPEQFSFQSEQTEESVVSRQYHFELITPMFGGDVESWKLDPKNPVRSSSVKGQLRFWWRTMQNEPDARRLLEKEVSRWGGQVDNDKSQKSPVSIAVIEQKNIKKEQVKANDKGNALGKNCIPNYILFPVIENVTKNKDSIYVITQLSFTLQISYPQKFKQEVLDTLKLWTLFGGVGARTRRGTGSIYCPQLLEEFKTEQDIKDWLDTMDSHIKTAYHYPRISGAQLFMRVPETESDPARLWRNLLANYGDYRQDRRPGNPRPGRSYWPEPDTIRALTRQSASSHTDPVNDEQWFPRAAFGLPILTKFSGCNEPGLGGILHLMPEGKERMPSPVTLKVIKLANAQVVRCALVLNQYFPEQLVLKTPGQSYTLNRDYLPDSTEGKKMKTNEPLLSGESVYQHLARSLELKELK